MATTTKIHNLLWEAGYLLPTNYVMRYVRQFKNMTKNHRSQINPNLRYVTEQDWCMVIIDMIGSNDLSYDDLYNEIKNEWEPIKPK